MLPALELFLTTWQGGRYASRSDRKGCIAIECTRIDPLDDAVLRPVVKALGEDRRLDLPCRHFTLAFDPAFLQRALPSHTKLICERIAAWSVQTLPVSSGGRGKIAVPLPSGKSGVVRVDVSVGDRSPGQPAISVRWDRASAIRNAITGKLPKLAAARADERLLFLESPGETIGWTQLETVKNCDWIVVADGSGFRVWDVARREWTEVVLRAIEPAPGGPLLELAQQAREFAQAAKADNTLRAYAADWNDFRSWCDDHALPPLPAAPETIALYLTHRAARLKTSSLARRLTTINRAHEAAGHPSPATLKNVLVGEVWKGIQRKKGVAEQGKRPLLTGDLRKILAALPESLQGVRDRALLLTGFAGGFRRSELARLRREDLQETADGFVATIRKSKTDQEGQGRPVALPYGSDPMTCPVRALRAWMDAAAIRSGPLFRGVDQFGLVVAAALCPDSVAWIVKRAARRAGLKAVDYAGHSLRAGLATQAAMNGAGELAIMKQTGHRSLATVRRYIRDGALFRDNAATKLGL